MLRNSKSDVHNLVNCERLKKSKQTKDGKPQLVKLHTILLLHQ